MKRPSSTHPTMHTAIAGRRMQWAGLVRQTDRYLGGLAALQLTTLLALACDPSGAAGLLAEGQSRRMLPFTVRADRPMIEATVAGQKGVLMIDNGTPDALFLNRAAVPLPPGQVVGNGFAASGQLVEVHAHPAPAVQVSGQTLAMSAQVRSGDFSFTAPAWGKIFWALSAHPCCNTPPLCWTMRATSWCS